MTMAMRNNGERTSPTSLTGWRTGAFALFVLLGVWTVALSSVAYGALDMTGHDGVPLSAQNVQLFEAAEAGDLVATQRAVLDGADARVRNSEGHSAADVAEILGYYSIAHFLRAYLAIEGDNPDSAAPDMAPVSAGNVPEPPIAQSSGDSSAAQTDYFARLSVLNPSPSVPEPEAPITSPQGQLADGSDDELQDMIALTDVDIAADAETEISGESAPKIVLADGSGAFDPPSPSRKPAIPAPSDESGIFALGTPAQTAQNDIEIPQDSDFFNRMRVFSEDKPADMASGMPADDLAAASLEPLSEIDETQEDIPAYERLRNAVLVRLRAESDERVAALLAARENSVDQAAAPDYVAPTDDEPTAEQNMAFVDGGYSAPPAGQSLDTINDGALAALGQMARLLATPQSTAQQPGVAWPGLLATLNSAAVAKPAPVSGAGLVVPPDFDVLPQGPAVPAMAAVPNIPVTTATAELAGPDSWSATATDSTGSLLNPSPVAPSASVLGGAGAWDSVAVQAAPAPARVLLGIPDAVSQSAQSVQQSVQPTQLAAFPVVAGGAALAMGQSVMLGKQPPAQTDQLAQSKTCIDKRRGGTKFCIERIDWPDSLSADMRVDTVMYQGLNAIVRYDNEVATRFHALFTSEAFNNIVNYYTARLGPPSNVWRRTITPLAAPKQPNPTVSWQRVNPQTQVASVLEIRQFDDTRGGFPDEKRGAVMLYSAKSGPIFPQVSAFELMRLHPGS